MHVEYDANGNEVLVSPRKRLFKYIYTNYFNNDEDWYLMFNNEEVSNPLLNHTWTKYQVTVIIDFLFIDIVINYILLVLFK